MSERIKDPFEEYRRETEPSRRERLYAWRTAIGLQDVDGLRVSNYLIETAKRNIDGEITLRQAGDLIETYYKERPDQSGKRTDEADMVSGRIANLLSENGFTLSPTQYLSIHKKLFQGILRKAGTYRDYNITKKEWVLDGDTVTYAGATELRATLEYDLAQEKEFQYSGLSASERIRHLAKFVSRLWQIHAFGEGNTRTTAVFFIKYMKQRGYDATNDIFQNNAWYFRNAMVRANYTNEKKGVYETTEYVERFLENLLLGKKHLLRNREMHIRWMENRTLKPQNRTLTAKNRIFIRAFLVFHQGHRDAPRRYMRRLDAIPYSDAATSCVRLG